MQPLTFAIATRFQLYLGQLVKDMTAYVIDLRTAYKTQTSKPKIEADVPELLDLIIKERRQLLGKNITITSDHTLVLLAVHL